ncbi:MAG TPA: sigma factor, partial [Phycicoccus sp.]|nr:sigma factor [Phycicoccus sp.]
MGLFRHKTPEEASAYAVAALPRLTRVARNLAGNRAAADDLVQDTLIKVLLHWEKVARAEGPDAYVRRIMVNTFVSG